MRQIEIAMANAIREKREWRQSNTEVQVLLGGSNLGYPMVYVYLHGNRIADLGTEYVFRDCGWPTVTTRSRLNAVFWAVQLEWSIYQKRWQQYIWRRDLGVSVPFYRTIRYTKSDVSIADWCRQHGFTDPFYQEGRWWAFPVSGVMPVPIAYFGSGT